MKFVCSKSEAVGRDATRHALQAREEHRAERDLHADEDQPERDPPERLIRDIGP